MEEQPNKICAICGKDCSKQKRVKDSKGRYYHKECVERAKREAKPEPEGGEFLGSAAVIAPPSEQDREGEYSISDSGDKEFPPAPTSAPTESVAHDDVDQYVIEGSGRHQSGDPSNFGGETDQVATPAAHTRIAAVPTRYAGEGGRAWPAIVGTVSILIGLTEAVVFGLGPVRGLIGGDFKILPLIVAVVAVVLALWLVFAGIGVVTRNQTAMIVMQKWAAFKILFSLVLVGGAIAAVLLDLGLLEQFESPLIEEAKEMSITSLIIAGVVRLIPLMIWPVLMIIWFGRTKTQEDIGFWR